MTEASCRDYSAETFFPSDSVGVAIARRICANCPVKQPCLDYALSEEIFHGIWGGASERSRQRLLRSTRELKLDET